MSSGVVVRRHIDFFIIITYPYSSFICSFLQLHPYFLFFFLYIITRPMQNIHRASPKEW